MVKLAQQSMVITVNKGNIILKVDFNVKGLLCKMEQRVDNNQERLKDPYKHFKEVETRVENDMKQMASAVKTEAPIFSAVIKYKTLDIWQQWQHDNNEENSRKYIC